MPRAKREVDHHPNGIRIKCPRCGLWNFLWNHSHDKKRPYEAGTYCKACVRILMREKYGPAARRRREQETEDVLKEQLLDYVVERLGPPDADPEAIQPHKDGRY